MKYFKIAVLLLFISSMPYYGYSEQHAQELPVNRAKLQEVVQQLQEIYFLGGDHLGYAPAMLEYLTSKYNIKPDQRQVSQYLLKEEPYRRSRGRRRDSVDFYSLLSGGLAIRETLQMETLRPSAEGEATVPLEQLHGPDVKPHPYKEMLRNRKFSIFSLADLCPQDFYYVHCNNMHKALDFFDYLNEVGGAIHQRTSLQSVDFHVKKKILNQLALLEHKEARKFYDYVIEEMAMVGSDPFVRNGSDVSLVFKVKHSSIFRKTIEEYREEFKKKYRAKEQSFTLMGYKAKLLHTADRKIYSVYLQLSDSIVVLSTSKKAAEIVARTYRKKRPSMADADDFKYMRSIYPAKEKTEDAFVYLSDAFIRRLVGPEVRIKEARRMREAIRIANLEKFSILYYHLYGKRASSLEDLLPLVDQSDTSLLKGLSCSEGSFAVKSAVYGQLGFMTPNLEIDVNEVTEEEAKEYQEFVTEYTRFWREYFDPIGIRIQQQEGMKVETCILPLIDNSIYTSLVELCGGAPVRMQAPESMLPGEVFSVSVKINKEFLKKGPADFLSGYTIPDSSGKRVDILQAFGDEIQISMLDAEPMVDVDLGLLAGVFMSSRFRSENVYFGLLAWSMFHPIRLSIPLQDSAKEEKFISVLDYALHSMFNEISRHMDIDQYTITYKKKKIKVLKASLFGVMKFRYFYTIHDNKLHLTTTESYIHKVIDEKPLIVKTVKKSGGFFSMFSSDDKGGDNKPVMGNMMALYRPAQLVREKDLFVLNMMESAKDTSLKNYGTYKLLTLLFPGEKDLAEKSIQHFGFELVCPSGGSYSIDKKGLVQNSVYGDGMSPEIRVQELVKRDPMKRFFSTEEVKIYLEFTKEGIKTVLNIQ